MNRTLLIGGVLVLLLAASAVQAEPAGGSILAIDVSVPVNPLAVHFVESALTAASHDGTRYVILTLSTNAGYSSSVTALARELQSSPVPVLVRSTVRNPAPGVVTYLERAGAGGLRYPAPASLKDFVSSVDGQTVSFHGRTVRLQLAGLPVQSREMSPIARLLAQAMTPTLAYVLLVIGLLGIALEFALPGFGVPGIIGSLSLLVSLVALGAFSVNFGGLLIIVLSLVLFVVDIKAPTHGILTAGGIVALVAGSVLLFPTREALPGIAVMRVAPAAIAVMTVVLGSALISAVVLGARAQRGRVQVGPQTLVGLTGVALTDVSPEGVVRVGKEEWSATAVDGDIRAGEEVDVVDVQGVHLVIMRRL